MSAQSPRPTDTDSASAGCSRRDFFRRTAAAGVGVGAIAAGGSQVAPRYSPVGRAAAIAPLGVVGYYAGVAAIGYLAGNEAYDIVTGDSRDYSGYTGGDALHNEVAKGGLEMMSADERVMTGIENNIKHSDNIALTKGKNAIITEMNAENGETAAQDAMETAIDEYFASIQENILTHYMEQVGQVRHHHEQVVAHENLTAGGDSGVFHYQTDNAPNEVSTTVGGTQAETAYSFLVDDTSAASYEHRTLTLLDGSTHEGVPIAETEYWFISPSSEELTDSSAPPMKIGIADPETYGSGSEEYIMYFDPERFTNAWAALIEQRDSVFADLTGFVQDVYAQYEPGEIPTEQLVDPITAATELKQDYDNRSGQSAHAAILGIPTTAEHTVSLEIASDEAEDGKWELEADIFTEHVPEDSDGNEVGFQVGETYDPSTWDKPLYVAYNYLDSETGEERGAFTQIESEFTIVEAVDSDGNAVDSFETTSRNNQTADVSEIRAELEALRKEWIKMQEEAQEEEEDGGSSVWEDIFGEDNAGKGGAIVGAIAVILAIVGIGQVSN